MSIAPIVSKRGVIATSATFLKIKGLYFDPNNVPEVNLYFWDGPTGVTFGTLSKFMVKLKELTNMIHTEYIDQSLLYESVDVSCLINDWSEEHITCEGIYRDMPSNQSGVYWVEITSFNFTTQPTIVADLIPRMLCFCSLELILRTNLLTIQHLNFIYQRFHLLNLQLPSSCQELILRQMLKS